MIVWENTSLLHKVDVGVAAAPRVMLGVYLYLYMSLLGETERVRSREIERGARERGGGKREGGGGSRFV